MNKSLVGDSVLRSYTTFDAKKLGEVLYNSKTEQRATQERNFPAFDRPPPRLDQTEMFSSSSRLIKEFNKTVGSLSRHF